MLGYCTIKSNVTPFSFLDVLINRCSSVLNYSVYKKTIEKTLLSLYQQICFFSIKSLHLVIYYKSIYDLFRGPIIYKKIEFIKKMSFDHGFSTKYIYKIIQTPTPTPRSSPSCQRQDRNPLMVPRKFQDFTALFEKLKMSVQKCSIKVNTQFFKNKNKSMWIHYLIITKIK